MAERDDLAARLLPPLHREPRDGVLLRVEAQAVLARTRVRERPRLVDELQRVRPEITEHRRVRAHRTHEPEVHVAVAGAAERNGTRVEDRLRQALPAGTHARLVTESWRVDHD